MASNQRSVFIDGEAGATGVAVRQLLEAVPQIALRSLPEAQRKDPSARQDMMGACDLVVLCLPDDAAREAVALAAALGGNAPKLLDASTAHRVDPEWTYGFPEMARDQPRKIAISRKVSNPGCYPTGAIALLRPLVQAGLVPTDYPITISAVSGYSGGGRSMIEAHDRTGGPAFELYALGLEHKHVPEIEFFAGLSRRPIFMPSVGHFRQGMLVCVPFYLDDLPGRPSGADLREALSVFYEGSEHITVATGNGLDRLEAEALNGTDQLELCVCANEPRRHAVLVARLDNLGKGASGAAVQNLRLMLDLGPAPD
ncbi:MAG TPA: N-acetyl-gamma-glutamyl-phosphate reductase [Stellaceae bacterium]|nr:N-acetyl-gamma-glutamyl-phosphate reductase [Stellaceae bacterium]